MKGVPGAAINHAGRVTGTQHGGLNNRMWERGSSPLGLPPKSCPVNDFGEAFAERCFVHGRGRELLKLKIRLAILFGRFSAASFLLAIVHRCLTS
jgi:hypothetical protein